RAASISAKKTKRPRRRRSRRMRRVDCCRRFDRIKIPILNRELNFPDHAHVNVYLALDLILKHAAGLGQLTHHDEDLAAVDELAVLGTKRDPLTDDELVYWHLRYLGRPALLLARRGFFAVPRLLPPFGATSSASLTPFSGRNSAPTACSASRSAVSVRGPNFSPPATPLIVGSLALRMGFTRRDAGRSGCSARQARSFH